MKDGKIHIQEIRVKGEQVLTKVRELVHQGNIRRIILKNDDGETVAEFPLTIGVVGALVAPAWVAIGAIAALVTHMRLVVERTADAPKAAEPAEAVTAGAERET